VVLWVIMEFVLLSVREEGRREGLRKRRRGVSRETE
jgi:hypothetical protein